MKKKKTLSRVNIQNVVQLWVGKYVLFRSFTPKFRTLLSHSKSIPETVKNAMVYAVSIIIQCVVLQWLADHDDPVACSCKYTSILLFEHCDRGFESNRGVHDCLPALLLCFRALRLADARQRSSNDLKLKQDRPCTHT
jgi:hypothetical protein